MYDGNTKKVPEGAATPSGEQAAATAHTTEHSQGEASPESTPPRKLRIYVASSWRCARQPGVVERLRAEGHEVYDFRHPAAGDGFRSWNAVDPDWQQWDAAGFARGLEHPVARRGYRRDLDAMLWADVCVLCLPCGRSAHVEAGWFSGRPGKRLAVLLDDTSEPELMYLLADAVCVDLDAVVAWLREQQLGRNRKDSKRWQLERLRAWVDDRFGGRGTR